MPSEFRIISNHQHVIKTVADLKSKIGFPVAATVSREASELVAQAARALAHVGPDPTYPRGRPHTRDTIRVQPLNQFATRVLANYGAPWEELRGGDHAFMTNAILQVEPEALDRFEQHSLRVIQDART
jgi:hypothetical protein